MEVPPPNKKITFSSSAPRAPSSMLRAWAYDVAMSSGSARPGTTLHIGGTGGSSASLKPEGEVPCCGHIRKSGTSISHGGVRIQTHMCLMRIAMSPVRIAECAMRTAECPTRISECPSPMQSAQCGWQTAQRGQQRAQCGSQNAQCELQNVPGRTAECPMRDADLSNEEKHTLSTHTALFA